LHRQAKGTPRIINALADHALMAGYVARTRTITAREVKRSIEHLELS
jgi:type II secretory pathway predicted ATPase ExeA